MGRGFTLLEVLVAISVLMVAVAAPITIVQKGLSSAVYTKNQMIASYLAQDAIEYIKNKRDYLTINSLDAFGGHSYDWNSLSIFSLCLTSSNPNGCQIDTIKNSLNITDDISAYSGSVHLKLGDNNGTHAGMYQYMDGGDTNFTRQIQITLDPYNLIHSNPNEAMVKVTVSWGSADNTVTTKALIYNY